MQFMVDWEDRIDMATMRNYRLKRIQSLMKEYQLDAVISFNFDNIRYFTSYRPLWYPIPSNGITRNCAILAQTGDPVLFVHRPDYARASSTMSWIPKNNIEPLYHLEREPDCKRSVREQLLPALKRLGATTGRVGVDALTMVILEELKDALPQAKLVDSSACFREAKAIKGPEEIECMRQASIAADIAVQHTIKHIEPGIRECELLGIAMQKMYSLGMEVPQCSEMIVTGEYTAPLRRYSSERLVRNGDLVFFDIGGCFNGYFSDFARVVVCGGKASEMQKRIYRCSYDAQMAAHETVKVGYTNKQAEAAIKKAMNDHGFGLPDSPGYISYAGHCIGINGNEAPRLADEPPFEFEAGMVFSVEPGTYIPGVPGGGGVRVEDTILVTETGNEILTRTPYCDDLLR